MIIIVLNYLLLNVNKPTHRVMQAIINHSDPDYFSSEYEKWMQSYAGDECLVIIKTWRHVLEKG
jgi:hypothetical protein